MKTAAWLLIALSAFLVTDARCVAGEVSPQNSVIAAQQYRAHGEPVAAAPDGNLFCQAQEFRIEKPGWQAKAWGENYYAATMSNTFLSRKGFLGAPEQCDETVASINLSIAEAGKYLVLVRYEAAYRFETQFRVRVEQEGKVLMDRLYGARDNVKIWPFKEGLVKEVASPWGAVENVVWEGHDALVELQKGEAKLSLIAGPQPAPQAKRNVNLVLLTRDAEQVNMRIAKEDYLPLDGMLTQAGDVWMKVTNLSEKQLTFGTGNDAGGAWRQHSPYWVHLRKWKPVSVSVAPGQTSDWVEVGSTMDSLNDGQWSFTGDGRYRVVFGLKNAAGAIEQIAEFSGQGKLALAGDADTRYSRRLRTQEQVLLDLLGYLKGLPMRGRTPTRTIIYGYTFESDINPQAVSEFKQLFGLTDTQADASVARGYIDVRDVSTDHLAEYCGKLGAAAKNIAVVSLGDEIGLPAPSGDAATEGFRAWVKAQGVRPGDIDPSAGDDWARITYNPGPALKRTHPGLYYWSRRYLDHYGIQIIKQRTDILRAYLPQARIGANYSPHRGGAVNAYLGEVFQWVNCFRDDGMTLPWSEDYAWQVPVGTQQMNAINLDLFRAGLRGKADRSILYYVMPHYPGNTPRMWRRLFHNALGHGMKIVNLFEFRPVQVAFTENHVTGNEMYGTVLTTFRELGLYEDIVQAGHVRPAETGLWFSETGDIWDDNAGSFAAAKRALYIAVRDQQLPLDVVVEQDALDGTLSAYKVLYLTDNHVSRAASEKIAAWVNSGGSLFATAGAGMWDEFNEPNAVMRKLLGVEQTTLDAPEGAQVGYIKQDMPFVNPVDTVTWSRGGEKSMLGVIAVRSRIAVKDAQVLGVLGDGSPAIVRKATGRGSALYCAFLPGLTYFKPAIPMRPVDRGTTDDAMNHFIPTGFDPAAGALITLPAADLPRPVLCSEPLVESTVIESDLGKVIPLVNWSAGPVKALKVTLNMPVPASKITLASGAPLAVSLEGGKTTITCDLDVADVMILR